MIQDWKPLVLGFPFGLLIGAVSYLRHLREKATSDSDEPPDVDDYPEELEAIKRRQLTRQLILVPTLVIAGYIVLLIVTGTGSYGVLGGGLTAYLVVFAFARYGGPNDPKWKRVEEEW